MIRKYNVRWGSVLSNAFTVSNGVRQGGILSPLLFNFYMNNLSSQLNNVYAGCCCASKIVNHLMYADDLVVFAPSAKGLQKLLDVCSKFGDDNDIIYNSIKSQLMHFDTKLYGNNTQIFLNDHLLKYVDVYKYLGHNIDNKLNDETDMKSKERSLYGRSNQLIRKFYFCSNRVKNHLFSSYCSNMYLCVLWVKYRVSAIRSLTVAFNNSFRILHNLSRRCSASGMFVNSGVRSYPEMYRKSVLSFIIRLNCSKNTIVEAIIRSDFYCDSILLFLWRRNLYVRR